MLDQLFRALAPFSPTLVGTFPLGLQVDGSDLDIACSCENLDVFERALRELPVVPTSITRVAMAPEAVVASLSWDGVPIEIFAQPVPVHAQAGFRHMVVEARLLVAGGDELRARVLALKRAGVKTEPAFARVLGLDGDPYVALLAAESWSAARIAGVVARALRGETVPVISQFDGDRAALRSLFQIADESDVAIDGYQRDGTVLVARDGADLVGHVQMIETSVAAAMELKSLAVLPTHRGTGLGGRLVEAGIAYARAHGFPRVVLSTAAADTHLLRFYQRLGFRFTHIDRDVFTVAAGYPPDLAVDGIRLLDRVWFDRGTCR